MTRLPVFFVSHGAPDLVISSHPARHALERLAEDVARPRALLVVSPHWSTPQPRLSASEWPETIHDFVGFPGALYRIRYPAPGAPALAMEVVERLQRAGFGAASEPRGMDHGVWAPLCVAFPAADIPVLSMSLPQAWSAESYRALGQALAPLRGEGVLILCSGTLTHNLAALAPEGTPPAEWSRAFQQWLLERLAAGDTETLMSWRSAAPHAARAHPSSEHLDPLWVALGAAIDAAPQVLYQGFTHGSLGMGHLRFD